MHFLSDGFLGIVDSFHIKYLHKREAGFLDFPFLLRITKPLYFDMTHVFRRPQRNFTPRGDVNPEFGAPSSPRKTALIGSDIFRKKNYEEI